MPMIPSLLPALFDWSFWVPFFFRIFLAVQLLREVRRLYRGMNPDIIRPDDSKPTKGALRGIMGLLSLLGLLLLLGLGTQVVGTIVACAMFVRCFQLMRKHGDHNEILRELLLLSGLVALSLVFLGPGPYSLDVPL